MLERLIGEDITIETGLAPGLGMVRADPGQVGQVLMNIALNARDAMRAGGVLSIRTRNVESAEDAGASGGAEGPCVVLTVADTGAGMTADVQEHVFEPFFTTKPPGEGTGLGLATVVGIVQQSEGTITVRSELGSGTTFEVILPRVDGVSTHQAVPEEAATGGSERVLFVEDNETVRGLVELMLREQGYVVVVASLPSEAIELFAAHSPFDIIVTDVVMPEMNGRELVEQLQVKQPGIGVLYTSGYTDDAMVARGALMPGVAFLQKPFTLAQLTSKVRDVIEASRARPA